MVQYNQTIRGISMFYWNNHTTYLLNRYIQNVVGYYDSVFRTTPIVDRYPVYSHIKC